ncbi:MAG TPA: universal stress protein [Candidatus Eisenbacteria bacterium]|jgi:nucleotide-binding universal stress UspA family protein
MKIMIAVDGSECSEPVVEFVARMRWPAGSRTMVVSVANAAASMVAAPFEAAAASAEIEAMDVREHEELVANASHALTVAGMPCETKVVMGEPASALLQAVRDESVDLLVVGSHGRTGFTKLLLGSVSAHLVSHAPCSVLVVKRTAGHVVADELGWREPRIS